MVFLCVRMGCILKELYNTTCKTYEPNSWFWGAHCQIFICEFSSNMRWWNDWHYDLSTMVMTWISWLQVKCCQIYSQSNNPGLPVSSCEISSKLLCTRHFFCKVGFFIKFALWQCMKLHSWQLYCCLQKIATFIENKSIRHKSKWTWNLLAIKGAN